MRINVGNMAFSTNDEDLRDLFSAFGTVASAEVVKDSEKKPQSRLWFCRDA